MDQIKTGAFIAELRKEKGFTQKELAERLLISDKTVSKWETGKGLPEVSLMLPLCDILGISVNELLTGERLSDSEYKRKAEENIVDLVKEREENKRKIIIAVVVCAMTLVSSVTIIMISGYLTMETPLRIAVIIIGLAIMAAGLGVTASLEMQAGTFECRHCKARFVPSFTKYIMGPHTLTKRYMKCPKCGKKSWCKKRLTH